MAEKRKKEQQNAALTKRLKEFQNRSSLLVTEVSRCTGQSSRVLEFTSESDKRKKILFNSCCIRKGDELEQNGICSGAVEGVDAYSLRVHKSSYLEYSYSNEASLFFYCFFVMVSRTSSFFLKEQ